MYPAAIIPVLFQVMSFTDALSRSYNDILPLIGMAFIISAAVTALLYMLGNALQSQEILANAKDNLGNLIFSIILIGLFFFLFQAFSAIATSVACGYSCDFLQAAYSSVLMLRTKVMSLYSNLYFYEIIFGFLSTIGFSIPPAALMPGTLGTLAIVLPSVSFSPLSGLTPLSNAHTVVVEAVGTTLLMVLARQVLLEFIMKYMYLFLALGIGMRALIFTRRTGSSILALAAVAFFVYPLAVMLSNYLIFHAYAPTNFGIVPTAIGYCQDPTTLHTLSEKFTQERNTLYEPHPKTTSSKWYMFWDTIYDASSYLAETASMMFKVMYAFNLKMLFAMILSPFAFSTFLDFLLIEIQSQVQFLVTVFVSFFVEIIITITMYRGVAMLVEGEAEIFGISKLM